MWSKFLVTLLRNHIFKVSSRNDLFCENGAFSPLNQGINETSSWTRLQVQNNNIFVQMKFPPMRVIRIN